MAAGEAKTQGTGLWLADRTAVATVLVKLLAPTGITGLTDGTADDIEDTSLDELTDKTYVKGLASPASVTVPFNLVPRDAGHQFLFEMQALGDPVDCYVGLSDGTGAPTLVGGAEPKVLTAPAARSGFMFKAYISNVSIDIATNEIVRGTLTLRRTGPVIPTWKP